MKEYFAGNIVNNTKRSTLVKMNTLFEERVDYALGGGDVFEESINDSNLFKAVFMAGGPGSGKGYVNAKIFDGTEAKVVNSDDILEFLMVKNNLPLKFDPKLVEVYKKQMAIRDKAKQGIIKRKGFFIDGMLPIVIDGTGKDFNEIKEQAEALKEFGYDVGMVFVNTTLEVAQARNKMRARTVPDAIVEKGWYEVQGNLGKFQSYFGAGSFFVVDNSKTLEGDEIQKFAKRMRSIYEKLINSPLQNKKGQNTIKVLTAIGGKYMADLPTTEVK